MIMNLPFSDILPCGVCPFDEVGELLECRAKSRVPRGAKSVITYLFPYWLGEEYYKSSNVSKYAVPADYHLIAGAYLERITEALRTEYPENSFEYFCDNSPINEVRAAVMCGLGVRGKNSLLINPVYGSFCFIGEIVTDKVLDYSIPTAGTCLDCGICVKKCPSGAISTQGVDRSICLSDITQRKGEISPEDVSKIRQSGCIWGCDICQDDCPMNRCIKPTPIREFYDTAIPVFKSGSDIKDRAYAWRGRNVIERNLSFSEE